MRRLCGGVLGHLPIPVTREKVSGSVMAIKVERVAQRWSFRLPRFHEQRGNANKILGRILNHLDQGTDIQIVSVNGGSKDNVIAGSSEAVIMAKDLEKAKAIVNGMEADIKSEFSSDEPNFQVPVSVAEGTEHALSKEATRKVIFAMVGTPYGARDSTVICRVL
ncbi:MAG: peptidase dimerization domain-containing protein [Sellimonas intestinalis]|uniref:peptidase dimerization domain-containing protein n=1 Tax=Sellimonas intestinalis TaxID=1653434 RepID=UPI0039A32906